MDGPNDEFYLLLGECDREGIVSKLKASKKFYRKKLLESKPENWMQIRKLLYDHRLAGVVVKLTNVSLSLATSAPHKQLADDIFSKISQLPNIVFIHESILLTAEARKAAGHHRNWGAYFQPLDGSEIDAAKDFLSGHGVNLWPYKANSEITNAAIGFIDETVNRLLFRIYVPNGRMWADEAGRLLELFRNYLTTVAKIDVREERFTTASGVIHELYSNVEIAPEALSQQFGDFSTLMDLAVTDRDAALRFVEERAPSNRVMEIVDKYAKELKRISIDMRQDRERKILSIKHRIEAEISEDTDDLNWNEIDQIIRDRIPEMSVMSALTLGPSASGLVDQRTLHVHQGPTIFGVVNGVVAAEINGDQHLGADAKSVLEIVQRFGGAAAGDLANAVLEVEDSGTRSSDRLTALGKIKRFAVYSAGKLGDVAFGVLQAYIESKAGL